MEAVAVLTIEAAAKQLGTSRYNCAQMLMRRELTQCSVDGRPAVLVDKAFRKAERQKALAGAA
jgi:hypothetical protein